MKKEAMLIDYGFCTGCKSCEISCSNEKELSVDEWGIKITELGPKKINGEWEWDYLPSPSRACDLCVDRRAEGLKAACELHCLADVIRIVPIEEVSLKMKELNKDKVVVFVP